jgi:hypothetical protein
MSKWPNFTITSKGEALLAKLIAGTKLTITRAVTGTGYVEDISTLSAQTTVTGEKQPIEFRALTYTDESKCVLHCRLSNSGITVGYTAMQLGVYATDPDDGEILFCIAQAESGNGTVVPSESDDPGYTAIWNLHIQFGQADGVEITVSSADTVTVIMMEDALAKKADKNLGNVEAATFAEKTMATAESLVVTTGGNGSAYTATVPGVTKLFTGLTFTMIPHVVSSSTGPTLNVNGLGALPLRQRLSSNTAGTTTGAISTWLSAGKPVSVTYDGSLWEVNISRPSATYLYGTVDIDHGGTGGTTVDKAQENLGIKKIINEIGNLHVWSKYDGDPTKYSFGNSTSIQLYAGYAGLDSNSLMYSDSIVCSDSKISLVEPKTLNFRSTAEAEVIKGKYIQVPWISTSDVYQIFSNAIITQEEYPIGSNYYFMYAVSGVRVIASASKLGYVTSWDDDTYPENGSDGTYWYTYKKQLGD